MKVQAKRFVDLFPKYSQKFLSVIYDDYYDEAKRYLEITGREHWGFDDTFAIERETDYDFTGKDVAVASLFFKPIQNFDNGGVIKKVNGQIPMSELIRPHEVFDNTREGKSFMENYVNTFLEADFGDWIPLVYLANDLQCLIPLFEANGIKYNVMKHSSIYHAPGCMWRYLALNLNCRTVMPQDTDFKFWGLRNETTKKVLDAHDLTMVRPSQVSNVNGNYATILGCIFAVDPMKIDFDAEKMMMGYIILNILNENHPTNFGFEPIYPNPAKGTPPLQAQIDRGYVGPYRAERVLSIAYPQYCIDESWLKSFVYYHLSNGQMGTLIRGLDPNDPVQSIDFQYQEENGNVLIEWEDAVRL